MQTLRHSARPAATSALVLPSGAAVTGTGWPQPRAQCRRPAPAPVTPEPAPAAPAACGRGSAAPPPDERPPVPPRDRSGIWLRNAAAGLAVLAASAAAVSFTAQYQMIYTARRLPVIAGLEAAIPDASALIFACLGIALALHGRRAIRARVLNVAAVGTSVFMNVIAAEPGWRSLAIWAMPPVAYALTSDTLIGVVRAWAIARHRALRDPLAAEEATPLAILGGLILWLLRLSLAPASTLRGFRAWVLTECPVAPNRRAAGTTNTTATDGVPAAASGAALPVPGRASASRRGTKTARFLDLVAGRHGPLAGVPLAEVSKIAAALAPDVGLDPGAARTALRRAVLAAQDGGER